MHARLRFAMAVYTSANRHRRARVSAGLLMYRVLRGQVEVFIAHPGGPWFPNRELDVWTIPKGELEEGEDLQTAAIREFQEEVGILPSGPYIELGSIKQKGGKTVHAWAFQGDWDESQPIRSNRIQVEWPPGSGRWGEWPEVDRAGFFPLPEARARLKSTQHPLLDRLVTALGFADIPSGDSA
jgi:predicted NUDIX family NTP pyrophosphohydrolase